MSTNPIDKELEDILGEAMGWVKYDQPEDKEMSPFYNMWVDHSGKTGRNLTGVVKKIQAYYEADRQALVEKVTYLEMPIIAKDPSLVKERCEAYNLALSDVIKLIGEDNHAK